jgi:purine catabolism regulator
MDITLDDVLAFEPRLVTPRLATAAGLERLGLDQIIVSWAVSTRALPPHLPALRGGEIVLVSMRAVTELGSNVAALLREAQLLKASAAVLPIDWFDETLAKSAPEGFPLLGWAGELTIDAETAINRHLTESRGDLYRIGSELERQLADVASTGAGLESTLRAASRASGLPLAVLDASGLQLASTLEGESSPASGRLGDALHEIRHQLSSGATLMLGPLRHEQRLEARFLAGRIAAAVESARRRDDAARPRGSGRVEATASLLSGEKPSATDQRVEALALGLDPDAVYLVAVSRGGNDAALARALAPLGAVHPAGGMNGKRAALVAASGRLGSTTDLQHLVAAVKSRWALDHERDGSTLALSAPAIGAASLPAASREAHFIATLQEKTTLPRLAASFESVEDVGALRLLYELRGSSELRQFISQALGELETRDQRKTLRTTLRAFLECGGSQIDAAHRLGIHRNTLAYRLRRIGELVGKDVTDPGSWLTLHLALRASEMLEVCRDDC